jgi:hypothetical protein
MGGRAMFFVNEVLVFIFIYSRSEFLFFAASGLTLPFGRAR